MKRTKNLVFELLNTTPPINFTGCGLVIYKGDIEQYSQTPLVEKSALTPPISDNNEIAKTIYNISNYSDLRHDGFHFINSCIGLTNISLFVSPPIPKNYKPTCFGVGARHRSAELISLLEDTEAVLVVDKERVINVFVYGKVQESYK